VWTGVDRCGQVWTGVDNCGQVWTDVDRCGQVAFTPRKYSCYSFLLEAELTPEPECEPKDYFNDKSQWHHRKPKILHSDLCAINL
jgi:hypothetical protein